MTDAQKTLYYISENMKMEKKISDEGYEHFQQAIKSLEQQPSDDCVSREEAKQFLYERLDRLNDDELYDIFSTIIDDMYNELPPVTPTHSMCKDCTKSKILNGFEGYSIVCSRFGRMAVNPDFYCADFEKRGSENE